MTGNKPSLSDADGVILHGGGTLRMSFDVEAPGLALAVKRIKLLNGFATGFLVAKILLFLPEPFLFTGGRLWSDFVEASQDVLLTTLLLVFLSKLREELVQPFVLSAHGEASSKGVFDA